MASGSKPRSEIEEAAGVKPVPLFEMGTPFAFAIGRFLSNSSVLRSPDLSISSREIVRTGLGPTSSAVGIYEPTTMMRSDSAGTGTGETS